MKLTTKIKEFGDEEDEEEEEDDETMRGEEAKKKLFEWTEIPLFRLGPGFLL